MTTADKRLVAPCGLFCGACHRYKKEKCPGCRDLARATWCKIPDCAREKGLTTCSGCTQFADVNQCKTFNNLISRFFALIFRSDRKASLARIDAMGRAAYAREMAQKDLMVLTR
ncbi:MAG: DUF3795 domain-containing protein [Desulfobacter sp.]|nr:MAG: DUF3795 domain-containing protein [Desulfobacter sp.]